MTLAHVGLRQPVTVSQVGGDRAFRRRLMELGLVPGTRVEVIGVAPLGDPLELLVRGCSLSIRRGEALFISIATDGNGCGTHEPGRVPASAPAPQSAVVAGACHACASKAV
jgi:ferrous iron transport protein A